MSCVLGYDHIRRLRSIQLSASLIRLAAGECGFVTDRISSYSTPEPHADRRLAVVVHVSCTVLLTPAARDEHPTPTICWHVQAVLS